MTFQIVWKRILSSWYLSYLMEQYFCVEGIRKMLSLLVPTAFRRMRKVMFSFCVSGGALGIDIIHQVSLLRSTSMVWISSTSYHYLRFTCLLPSGVMCPWTYFFRVGGIHVVIFYDFQWHLVEVPAVLLWAVCL